MSWIPSLPRTLVLLRKLKAGEDDLKNSSELFWLFSNASLPPEEFYEDLISWSRRNAKDKPKGGGFIDLEIEALINQGLAKPEKVVQEIVDSLDDLSKIRRVLYRSGQADDPAPLYIFTHIESTRLIRLLNVEGYSGESRTTLQYALNAYTRCEMALGTDSSSLQPKYLLASLKAVGSFLYTTQFSIQRLEAQYEEALRFWIKGINLFQQAQVIAFVERSSMTDFSSVTVGSLNSLNESRLFSSLSYFKPQFPRWVQTLIPQVAADCFEALKSKNRIKDTKLFVNICGQIADICREKPWLDWDKTDYLKDSNDNLWETSVFWEHAKGWAEAQLNPSQLQELLQESEDKAAERRLRVYFFSDELWKLLPERAKSSLINADRDWFSGTRARNEAVLNELRVATEELLFHSLWRPLNHWISNKDDRRKQGRDFLHLEERLHNKKLVPSLVDYEKIFGMQITKTFLADQKISEEQRCWLLTELASNLSELRKARGYAEHESTKGWTREQLGYFVNKYLGIGQTGVLPRLARLLFLLSASV